MNTQDFNNRFQRWKNGERYWDIRGIDLPRYDNADKLTDPQIQIPYNTDNLVYNAGTLPEVEVTAENKLGVTPTDLPDIYRTTNGDFVHVDKGNAKDALSFINPYNNHRVYTDAMLAENARANKRYENFEKDRALAQSMGLNPILPFEDIANGQYKKSFNDSMNTLSWFGGAGGALARGYVGARNMFSDDGISKTINLFSNGQYGRGTLSAAGDILNLAFMKRGARQLSREYNKYVPKIFNQALKFNEKYLGGVYRRAQDLKNRYTPYEIIYDNNLSRPIINASNDAASHINKPSLSIPNTQLPVVNKDLSINHDVYNSVLKAAGFSPEKRYVQHPTYGNKVNTDQHMMDVYNTTKSMPTPLGFTNQQLSTAALLHDIGEIVQGRPNHGKVGSDFLRSYFNFDNAVIDAVENHMAAEDGLLQSQSELTKALHLADVGRGRSFRQQIHDYPLMGYRTQNSTKIQVPNNLPFEEQVRRINFILGTIGEPTISPKNAQELHQLIQKSVHKLNSYIRGYKRDVDFIKNHRSDAIKNVESDLGRALTEEEISHINALIPGNGMRQWYKPEFLSRVGAYQKDGFTTNDVLYASQNAEYSRKNYGDLSIITAPIDYQHLDNPLQFLMDNLHNINQNVNTFTNKYDISIDPHPLPSPYEYGIPEMAVNGTSTWKAIKPSQVIDFSQETSLEDIQKHSPRFSLKKVDPYGSIQTIGQPYRKSMNDEIQRMMTRLKDAGIDVVTDKNTVKYPTILYQMQKHLDNVNFTLSSIQNYINSSGILQQTAYPAIQSLLSNLSKFYASKRPYIEFNKQLRHNEKINILFKYLRRGSDTQATALGGIRNKRASKDPLADMAKDRRLDANIREVVQKLNTDLEFRKNFMRQASNELVQILKNMSNISKEQMKSSYKYNMRNVFKKEKVLQSSSGYIDPDVFYERTGVEPMSVSNMGDPNKMMFVSKGNKKSVGILTKYGNRAKGFTYRDVSNMSDEEVEKETMSRIMGLLTLFAAGGTLYSNQK